jgi:hypothetical protein
MRVASGASSSDSRTVSAVYEGRSLPKALPSVGQLGDRLPLSPQGLRSHKALEVKRVFPRKHGVHGPPQLMGEHGERCGFAVLVFKCGKICFARLTLTNEEHGGFGKRPPQLDVANLFTRGAEAFAA